jgi:hypothetical protein
MHVDFGEQFPVGGVCWTLHQLGSFIEIIVEIARRWI